MESSVTALGVDPGLAATGFAVVEICGERGRACQWGTVKTRSGISLSERLDTIYTQLSGIISRWQPRLLVVEDVFVYHKFPKAAIQLGAVRGAVFLAAEHQKVSVCELKPTEVKSALTGNGRASKAYVGKMTQRILNIREIITPDHASDAMALAITGLSRNGFFCW